jgi:hypothetical protein
MQLSDVFLQLGEERLRQLVRTISIGKLRTYQLYDRFKTRTHLTKVNTENLRGAVPKFLKRLEAHDVEFTTDLSQAILISHLDMISTVLNFLGIPNQEGFFEKDIDAKPYLTEGWQTRVYDEFKAAYDPTLLLFYINHLDLELGGAQQIYLPAA